MRMGGEMLEKSHKGKKIDAAVALVMAFGAANALQVERKPLVMRWV